MAIAKHLVLLALASTALPAELWWERGADTWYYKDDWKGLALDGARAYSKAFDLSDGAAGGWIVVWGDRGYALKLNGKLVGESIDGGLMDDYDLGPFVEKGAGRVELLIEGSRVCAEGELVDAKGKRHAFATGEDWQAADGKKPRTQKLEPGPSHGAFHRAHNGRLMAYDGEERGKAAIAKGLARIQRFHEQCFFLLRRVRSAADILSFDPDTPWRRAEAAVAPLVDEARSMLRARAIPAQKAGKFSQASAAAGIAAKLLGDAEAQVLKATLHYRAAREDLGAECEAKLRAAGAAGRCSRLDEFPDDRFAWLNARELMGNDPARWPFALVPPSSDYIDLAGPWEFQTDPANIGIEQLAILGGWKRLLVPGEWERQGVTQDNPKSPGDCPYKLGDGRTGDKPYNGFAWYQKTVLLPASWRGKKIVLSTGSISNWARVFINGKPLNEGRMNPPPTQEVPTEFLMFGGAFSIAIQVYNHDNFGGIVGGPLALYAEGANPTVVETPGPLSYTREYTWPTAKGPVRYTLFASAMSPAVLVATDGPTLGLLCQGKGYHIPGSIGFVADDGFRWSPEPGLDGTPNGAKLR